MFFSGIPLEGQAGAGSGGQAGTRGGKFGYTNPYAKAGGNSTGITAVNSSKGPSPWLYEDQTGKSGGMSARSKKWRRGGRILGFAAGVGLAAPTGGATVGFFRKGGFIARNFPEVARGGRAGSFAAGLVPGMRRTKWKVKSLRSYQSPFGEVQEYVGEENILNVLDAILGFGKPGVGGFLK
jgi:hypothetical protein